MTCDHRSSSTIRLRTKIDGSMSLDRDACFLSPLLFRLITDKGYFHIQCSIILHMISYLSVMLAIVTLQDTMQQGSPCRAYQVYITQTCLSTPGMRVSSWLDSTRQTGMSALQSIGLKMLPCRQSERHALIISRLECVAT